MSRVWLLLAATTAISAALLKLGRHLNQKPSSWIDQRIAAERDPGRRAAWRAIRDTRGGTP
ncbi:hypothetical protein [Streptomyces sp. MS191]|uniref:hypothetical protein n=1 Tax=Streptomyces sp. ms191 TaxID=1827978 RepID=UPI0011CECF95|nr:hypothetical protein [Streptomyces sp. ms191]